MKQQVLEKDELQQKIHISTNPSKFPESAFFLPLS